MNFKKVISSFTIIATLSVFSCSLVFLWAEFSSHVLAKSEICSAEQHCLDDCVVCDISQQAFAEHKVLNTDNEALSVAKTSDSFDHNGDTFIYANSPPSGRVLPESCLAQKLPEASYALAHHRVKNVILIL